MSSPTTEVEQPVLRPSRRLPSGRAVLGGLLITLAVLGVLLATRLGNDATIREVVVARQDLAPGTVIEPEHIAQIEIRLAEDVDWVVTDPESIYGSVLLGPVARLEFVQFSNLTVGNPESVPSGLAVVSIEIDPGRAPAQLAAGELVTILATYDNENPATTRRIAENVVVLSYVGESEFSSNTRVLRLGTDDGAIASEIVTASLTGEVSIIGVTGATDVQIPEISQ